MSYETLVTENKIALITLRKRSYLATCLFLESSCDFGVTETQGMSIQASIVICVPYYTHLSDKDEERGKYESCLKCAERAFIASLRYNSTQKYFPRLTALTF